MSDDNSGSDILGALSSLAQIIMGEDTPNPIHPLGRNETRHPIVQSPTTLINWLKMYKIVKERTVAINDPDIPSTGPGYPAY